MKKKTNRKKPQPQKTKTTKSIDIQQHAASPRPQATVETVLVPADRELCVQIRNVEDYFILDVLGYPYYISAQRGADGVCLEICSKRRRRPNSDEFDKLAFQALDEYESLLKQGECEFFRISPVIEGEGDEGAEGAERSEDVHAARAAARASIATRASKASTAATTATPGGNGEAEAASAVGVV